jgi:hypothetical protein
MVLFSSLFYSFKIKVFRVGENFVEKCFDFWVRVASLFKPQSTSLPGPYQGAISPSTTFREMRFSFTQIEFAP